MVTKVSFLRAIQKFDSLDLIPTKTKVSSLQFSIFNLLKFENSIRKDDKKQAKNFSN